MKKADKVISSRFYQELLPAGAILSLLILSCVGNERPHAKNRFFRMDTVVDITVVAGNGVRLSAVWDGIDSLLKDWEERFSQTHPRSEVKRLNSRRSHSVEISPVLAEMLATATAYGDTLGGTFDITILPVKEAWGFGENDTAHHVPSQAQVREALSRVGYQRVRVDAKAARVAFADSQVMVDVGGVAKGFALREVARFLDGRGHSDYLVVAGGDIVCRGKRGDGRPWRIGIQHPREAEKLLATFLLDSGSVVTSGDYERFWVQDGVRYHHIFDPASGSCCRANMSVTVWGTDEVEADILSTGLFCRPAPDILSFVNARARLECVVVDSGGTMYRSDGWTSEVTTASD